MAPVLITLSIVLSALAWFGGGRLGAMIEDRQTICRHAAIRGVSWRWYESTATIRLRIRNASWPGGTRNDAIERALLGLTGARSIDVVTIATGRVAITVHVAWWAKLLCGDDLMEDACAIVEAHRPVGTAIAVVIP